MIFSTARCSRDGSVLRWVQTNSSNLTYMFEFSKLFYPGTQNYRFFFFLLEPFPLEMVYIQWGKVLHPIWSRISIGMEWRGLLAKDGKEKKHLRMNVIIAARACDISKEQCPSLFTGKDQGEGGDGTTNDHSTTEPFLQWRVLPPTHLTHLTHLIQPSSNPPHLACSWTKITTIIREGMPDH